MLRNCARNLGGTRHKLVALSSGDNVLLLNGGDLGLLGFLGSGAHRQLRLRDDILGEALDGEVKQASFLSDLNRGVVVDDALAVVVSTSLGLGRVTQREVVLVVLAASHRDPLTAP